MLEDPASDQESGEISADDDTCEPTHDTPKLNMHRPVTVQRDKFPSLDISRPEDAQENSRRSRQNYHMRSQSEAAQGRSKIIEICISSRQPLPKQFSLAKLFKEQGIYNTRSMKYLSPCQIKVEVCDRECAMTIMTCGHFLKQGWNITSTIDTYCYGVIKNVEADLSEKDIFNKIQCFSPAKLKEVKRLSKLVKSVKGGRWVPSECIRLRIKVAKLPDFVLIDGQRVTLEKYMFPVSQCKRCWKFNHDKHRCNSPNLCPKCGGTHYSCDTTSYKCINCDGDHDARCVSCPAFERQRDILETMHYYDCGYDEAVRYLRASPRVTSHPTTTRTHQHKRPHTHQQARRGSRRSDSPENEQLQNGGSRDTARAPRGAETRHDPDVTATEDTRPPAAKRTKKMEVSQERDAARNCNTPHGPNSSEANVSDDNDVIVTASPYSQTRSAHEAAPSPSTARSPPANGRSSNDTNHRRAGLESTTLTADPPTTALHTAPGSSSSSTTQANQQHGSSPSPRSKPGSVLMISTPSVTSTPMSSRVQPLPTGISDRETVNDSVVEADVTPNCDVTVELAPQRLDISTRETQAKYVPKSHLFKCQQCELHYLFAANANGCKHADFTAKTQSRCSKCSRKFRKGDIRLHEMQHRSTNDFDIISIEDGHLPNHYLYRCDVCSVHVVDYTRFQKHASECNKDAPDALTCPYCQLLIHKLCFPKHMTRHFKKKDNMNVEVINCVAATEPEYKNDAQVLFYCSTCKCVYTKKNHNPYEGDCSKIPKKICDRCGLCVPSRSFDHHLELHKQQHVTLYDLVIRDIRTDEEIIAPMTSFPFCGGCEVHFGSEQQYNEHVCPEVRTRSCDVCHKQFEVRCYMNHRAFHDVNGDQPEEPAAQGLMGFWNILYQCRCTEIFPTREEALLHERNHRCESTIQSQQVL